MLDRLLLAAAPYRKALVAGALLALATGLPMLADGLTYEEAGLIVAAFSAGSGITWRIPNAAK